MRAFNFIQWTKSVKDSFEVAKNFASETLVFSFKWAINVRKLQIQEKVWKRDESKLKEVDGKKVLEKKKLRT